MTTIQADPNLGAQIVADAKEHVLYSWSVQDAIAPIAVAGADGRHFWDYDGKRYLDFASQLVNVSIGYGHPKVVAAIKEQAENLATIGPPMATESRSRLGKLLAEVTPGDLSFSFASAPPFVKKVIERSPGVTSAIRRASVERGSVAIGGPIVQSLSAWSLIAWMIFGCWCPMLTLTSCEAKSR